MSLWLQKLAKHQVLVPASGLPSDSCDQGPLLQAEDSSGVIMEGSFYSVYPGRPSFRSCPCFHPQALSPHRTSLSIGFLGHTRF